MKGKICLLVCVWLMILVGPEALAQLTDDFTDGDFTQNPIWTGDGAHFKISSSTAIPDVLRPGLQLDAPGAGTSRLMTEIETDQYTEWRFWLKLSFNTSSNNFAKIFLVSPPDVAGDTITGYFMEVGGTNDSVSFCRQEGDTAVHLFTGKHAYTGNSTNAFFFRIIYRDGVWSMESKAEMNSAWSYEGGCQQIIEDQQGLFILDYHYTSSNTTKFYFDHLYVGDPVIDTLAPTVTSVIPVDWNEISVVFSEQPDTATALITTNYTITDPELSPDSISLNNDPGSVALFFSKPFSLNVSYQLLIQNIRDHEGNEMDPSWNTFTFHIPLPLDVVINEIMADPSPFVDLPEVEYLELHNVTGYPVPLKNWHITSGNTTRAIPETLIGPNGYLLLCREGEGADLADFGPLVEIPSFSLPNAGQLIRITSGKGDYMHGIRYDASWYGDPEKSEGGWSLEQLDPQEPCHVKGNWSASDDERGGTPGLQNSMSAANQVDPEVTRFCTIGQDALQIVFNQSMDSGLLANVQYYHINQGLGHPDKATPLFPDFSSVTLSFTSKFDADQIYTLNISDSVANCKGLMPYQNPGIRFGLPSDPDSADLVINEVLFNPHDDGVDYVEAYNRSGKVIDMSKVYLGTIDILDDGQTDTITKPVIEDCLLVLPQCYLLLTKDINKVSEQYFRRDPAAFVEMGSFPSYPNESGSVLLSDRRGRPFDIFHYHEEMHYPLLYSKEGVALERVHYDLPAWDPNNWNSASEESGFGTPGMKNSQFTSYDASHGPVALEIKVFTPDGDGKNDVLPIEYTFDQPGLNATVTIFNLQGYYIKKLVNNEYLGTSGCFFWDGTDDGNRLVSPGNYIILFEVFGMDGNVERYKHACGLVR